MNTGISRLICIASKEFPRYSEGDVVELADGRLLLALGRKNGPSDFAKGTLVGWFSSDRGVSWDDQPHVIQDAFADVGDLMSVSFCRSPRGVHLFFLGRGADPKADTRVYQMISADEGESWGKPIRVSERAGYHVVNNARVIRTTNGRMIVPAAYLEKWSEATSNRMGVYCMLSDDDGKTWARSNDLSMGGEHPLYEPGVAECADGSLYMTIRTKEGVLYEARSRDAGKTWIDFGPTKLTSPSAPSTVHRDATSDDLWMFWINRPAGEWKQRNPLAAAVSHDHGKTWEPLGDLETDAKHSYGYYSVTHIDRSVLLTYYDWADNGQPGFRMTNLRQRTIPLDAFHRKPVAPVFEARREPVIAEKDAIVSTNSSLLIEKDRWRLWYTQGTLGPAGERLGVRCAESKDRGITWAPLESLKLTQLSDKGNAYHARIHRVGDEIVMHVWKRDGEQHGLYRYVSQDDGKTFSPDPDRPLFVHRSANEAQKKLAGDGCVSNDAFDVLHNDRGSWEYFAACLQKATDARTVIKHDNAAGWLRIIGRSASSDGIAFAAPQMVIQPDYSTGDRFDLQFYGVQVFQHRKFYLGLLHAFHVESQTILPEWTWSHDGQSWARTGVPCIALGDEGNFDSRMILFGSVAISADEVVWLYSGSDWRHNSFKLGNVRSYIGRATLPLKDLDAWLDTLPQP